MSKLNYLFKRLTVIFLSILLLSCEKQDLKWNLDKAPKLSDITFSTYTLGSAELICECVDAGNNPNTKKGFCWSISSNPTLENNVVYSAQMGIGKFNRSIDWSDQEKLFVRAFAINDFGTVYSKEVELKDLKNGDIGPAGGYIFYVNTGQSGGWTYLEAAPTDYGSSSWNYPLSNFSTTNNYNTIVGSGSINTNSIVNFYGSKISFAASICLNLTFNNYSDWFLPSRDELIKIYENLFRIGKANLATGGIYWSSSEDINFTQNAWTVKMSTNDPNRFITYIKSNSFRVRPIRRF
jgi:hypothetical protein